MERPQAQKEVMFKPLVTEKHAYVYTTVEPERAFEHSDACGAAHVDARALKPEGLTGKPRPVLSKAKRSGI